MKNEKKLILDLIAAVSAAVNANPPTKVLRITSDIQRMGYDLDAVNAAMPAGCVMTHADGGHITMTMPNGMVAKTTPEGLDVIKKNTIALFDSAKFGERAIKKGGGKNPRFGYATLHPRAIAAMNGGAPCYDAVNIEFQVQQAHDNLRTAQASGNANLIATMQKQAEQLRDQVGAGPFRDAVLSLAKQGRVVLDKRPDPAQEPVAMAA